MMLLEQHKLQTKQVRLFCFVVIVSTVSFGRL